MQKTEQQLISQLRETREKLNMSQMEVSLKLGYKTNIMYRIESGKTELRIRTLTKINSIYGTSFNIE